MALIVGLESVIAKEKFLEKLQDNYSMLVAKIAEYVQKIEHLKDFINHRTNASNFSESINMHSNSDIHFQNKSHEIKNYKLCGSMHPIRKCPAFGKTCLNCGKINHFAKVCRSKTFSTHVHAVDSKDEHILFLSETQSINSIECKLQDIIIVKHPMSMQINTGASCTIISSNIWSKMGKPKLSRCSKTLEAYDGHTYIALANLLLSLKKMISMCWLILLL